MFASLQVTWRQAREAFAEEGVKGIVRPRLFWRRTATPVEMDLRAPIPFPLETLRDGGYEFFELRADDLRAGHWSFLTPSRGCKAALNLKKGWRGFALHQQRRVIGDLWCVTPGRDAKPIRHSDLVMLGIVCNSREAYAFDMHIAPAFRGKNLAAPLQRCLQAALKAEGIQKVYGYYWDDNLPALWMHRILKFKELPKRQVTRFFWRIKAQALGASASRR